MGTKLSVEFLSRLPQCIALPVSGPCLYADIFKIETSTLLQPSIAFTK